MNKLKKPEFLYSSKEVRMVILGKDKKDKAFTIKVSIKGKPRCYFVYDTNTKKVVKNSKCEEYEIKIYTDLIDKMYEAIRDTFL